MGFSTLLVIALAVHIAGGVTALATGVAAMFARKGGPSHARCGSWFFFSMIVMATTATGLALLEPDRLSAVAGVLTLYLICTSWRAATERSGQPALFEYAATSIAVGCVGADIWLGMIALGNPDGELDGNASTAYFVFAGLAALAVALDVNIFVRGKLARQQRIGRHLWRMCVAYFLAATSLFLGQQDDVFPFMIGSPILFLPSLATLAFMLFWIVRNRPKSKPRKNRPLSTGPADLSI